MRSSVVESRPPVRTETQGSHALYQPAFRPPCPYPDPQRQRVQPATRKSPELHHSLTPGEGWLAMLLLTIAVYSVVFSIIFANWVSNSYILLLSTAIGLLLGLCIAKIQRFPQAILHLVAVLVGHWLSIWLTSFAFHIPWLHLLDNLRSVISGGFTATASTNSEIVFLFYLTFLSYFLGYFGAWLIYRAHLPWLVALVYCAIMLVNLNYIKQDLSYLVIIMLGALILLIVRIQLINQLAQWTHEGLYTDHLWLRNITRQFVQVGAFFTLLVILIASILPIIAQPESGSNFWNNLDNAWANIIHGQLSLSNPGSLFQPNQPPTNFFGDQLTITGDVNLPSGEVLYYTSSAQSHPYYLEGFTYDNFDGHTWTSTTSNAASQFEANISLPIEATNGRQQVTTKVTIVKPPESTKHYLFAPAQPVSFNVRTTLYGNSIITAWTQQSPLTPGESYQAISLIPGDIAQELLNIQSPQNNPNLWSNDPNFSTLKQFYLETPSDLPSFPIVQTTLNQWIRGSTNVYDAMKKLQSHLSDQTQFRYSVSNPPVPSNEDAVAWLLQTHQGYCTYYATAMTIMTRMLGIPARIVNGFDQGSLQGNKWVVNGTDAHSWVQVYFPGFGWINVEPTPGFSTNTNDPTAQPSPAPVKTQPPTRPTPIVTPEHQKPGSQPTPTPGSTGSGTNTTSPGAIVRQNLFLTLSLATLLGSVVMFCFALLFRYKGNKPSASVTASTIYRRVCRLGALIGSPPQRWQTPYEYYRMLGWRFPQVAAPMRRVTELFVRERWAAPHQAPGPAEEQSLEKLWPHLRNTLIRSFFSRRGM